MVRYGDGLKQLVARYGDFYEVFRGYHRGIVDRVDRNETVGATGEDVQMAGNRMMGCSWMGM